MYFTKSEPHYYYCSLSVSLSLRPLIHVVKAQKGIYKRNCFIQNPVKGKIINLINQQPYLWEVQPIFKCKDMQLMCTLFNRGIFIVLLNVLKLKIHFKFFPVQANMKHFLTCMVQVQNYLKCKLKKIEQKRTKKGLENPFLIFTNFISQLNISVHLLSEQSKQYIVCNMY